MIENWFPYNIGVVFNPNHSLIEEKLTKRCYEVQKEYSKSGGEHWISKVYNTSTTDYKLHEDETFKELLDWVQEQVQTYSNTLEMLLNNEIYVPKIEGAWFNFYEKGDFQEYHTHPSILSCIYYLKSDSDGARTIFTPKTYETHRIEYGSDLRPTGRCWHKPQPGKLLIFRGFMNHCVEQKTDDKERITLAFNYD
ncbi:2OG-Fe(II) oxygenase family protein [bacterium]|nr:2OG-Fe(II) oxygenase family protein [bacterium]